MPLTSYSPHSHIPPELMPVMATPLASLSSLLIYSRGSPAKIVTISGCSWSLCKSPSATAIPTHATSPYTVPYSSLFLFLTFHAKHPPFSFSSYSSFLPYLQNIHCSLLHPIPPSYHTYKTSTVLLFILFLLLTILTKHPLFSF